MNFDVVFSMLIKMTFITCQMSQQVSHDAFIDYHPMIAKLVMWVAKEWGLYIQIQVERKSNTMYHYHTFRAFKCMLVVDSVSFMFIVGIGTLYLSAYHTKLDIQSSVLH